MKVAIVYPYPPPIQNQKPVLPEGMTSGGGETYPLSLAKAFASKGIQTDYISGKLQGISASELHLSDYLTVKYLPVYGEQSIMRTFAPKLLPLLVKGKYDLINSNQLPLLFTTAAGIASRLTNARHVVSHHGFAPRFNRKSTVLAYLNSLFVDNVTVQNSVAAQLYEGIIPQRKMVTIQNGLDTSRFHEVKINSSLAKQYDGSFVVGYVGRLLPSKGLDTLVMAVKNLYARDNNIRLILAGTGPFEEYLRGLIERESLSHVVSLVGFVPDEDLNGYYSLFDVFVLPSVYTDVFGNRHTEPEAFGLVLGEAMLCNTPTIATNVGGVPDWIHDGVNGYLVEPSDVTGLTEKISWVMNNPQSDIINKSREVIESKYSIQSMVQKYLELLT
ncbi:hypothetical protein CO179_03335 [candidate division WWE3 bacterium CG_4_9_14_3_um_filter_39_7]|uniref:Glycosyltransferase family 1 protein n=2 Tax=Katanobacteria TaxID=422282 RepID=A0A2M7X1Q2_UNCKA|nr:MAG: hypothetical protein CO179_03335 [candidate division WWE3 bacterium CG_4_9_14_3_um_filter_39_7]